jgi:tRNA uridine 5-carboxymethylaminomethyl modification enzyme
MARESASRIRLGGETLLQLMKRPEFRLADLPPALRTEVSDEIWESLETDLKYEGYIRRHNEHLQSIQAAQANKIPVEINYASVPGLRNEARQKLAKIRPESIGQAGRISGVTPSDLGILTIWIRKNYVTH